MTATNAQTERENAMTTEPKAVLVKALLPPDLHRRLKMYAVAIGARMPDAVAAVLDKHLPRYKA